MNPGATAPERAWPPVWIWALALLPRLAVCALVAAQPTRALVYADSFEYAELSKNLALRHCFATRPGVLDQSPPGLADASVVKQRLLSSVGPPFHVERFRTPGYPIFMAPWFHSQELPTAPIALLQCLVGALAVALCWKWGARMGGSRGAAWAAVFAALDPPTFIHASLLVTDTLHAALFLLAIFLFWRLLKDAAGKPLAAAFSGLAFGAAIMVRPVSLYLPIVLAAFLWRRRKCLVVFLLAAYLLPALWTARNYRNGGQPVFSCMTGSTLAWLPNEFGMIKADFSSREDLDRFACASLLSPDSSLHIFLRCVAAHPLACGVIFAKRLFYLFEGTSWDMLADMLRGAPAAPGQASGKAFQFQRAHPAFIPLWAASLVLLLLLYGAFVKGCWRLFKDARGTEALLLIGCCLYLTAATIPLGGSARFRIPITPLLAVGAAAGCSRQRDGSN
jgi:hypothetical protein